MTIWLIITYCVIGALYALAARRIAIRLGRRSLAWPVLAFWAGPLALPVLLMMKPHGTGQSVIPPRLFAVVTITLMVVSAGATSALFLRTLNPTPERVVATTHLDGLDVPTEADGPTAFAMSMLLTSAALLAGAAAGGLIGLLLAPPIAFVIHRVQRSKPNGPNASTIALGNPGDSATSIWLPRLVAIFLSGALLLLAGWTYAFGMPQSAGLSFFLALTSLLWLLRGRLAVRFRIALMLAPLGMAVLSWKTPARELRSSLQRLQAKKDTAGATAFSTTEK